MRLVIALVLLAIFALPSQARDNVGRIEKDAYDLAALHGDCLAAVSSYAAPAASAKPSPALQGIDWPAASTKMAVMSKRGRYDHSVGEEEEHYNKHEEYRHKADEYEHKVDYKTPAAPQVTQVPCVLATSTFTNYATWPHQ